MKWWWIGLTLLLLAGIGYGLSSKDAALDLVQNTPTEMGATPSLLPVSESIDLQAGFAIFTEGTFRVFTAAMYHNQSEDVFITADNPNALTVKRSGITWGDFFGTLPMKLDATCLMTGTGRTFCTTEAKRLRFYINEIEDPLALGREIGQGDRLLVTYGSKNDSVLYSQFDRIPNFDNLEEL